MIKKLTLENFKNFRHAELELGPFSLLIGANATGKSNIREAFRFLHGISRGYTLPEIIGEKWIEGGVRVWNGIRGGTQEICYQQPYSEFDPFAPTSISGLLNFTFEVDFDLHNIVTAPPATYYYRIGISLSEPDHILFVDSEILRRGVDVVFASYHTSPEASPIEFAGWAEHKQNHQPYLSLIAAGGWWSDWETGAIEQQSLDALKQFKPMRFFDFVPSAMRKSSLPGQIVLGDDGENLSSVLYAVCQNPQQKRILLSWIEDLPEMDIVDFAFPADQIGRILLTAVERGGQRISAYSLSDGTLRFLAMLAAFLGPERAKLYFFEELENGVHPTRLHLLTHFIENQVSKGDIQVIATTHSPLLLNYLSPETLEYTSLLYRQEGKSDAHIKRIVEIPYARDLIAKQGVMRLYESGWFEDVMSLSDEDETAVPIEATA